MENSLSNVRSRMLVMIMQSVNLEYGWDGVRRVLTDFTKDEAMDIVLLSFGSQHPYVEKVNALFQDE